MPDRPPIIIRKKIVHNSHHGGAWKVAYADFVTAMMSLFIVLWLMNSSASVKDAVAGYFKDPKGTGKLTGSDKAGKGPPGTGRQPTMEISKDDMPRLKEQLEKSLATLRDFQKLKNQVAITLAPEGLRIEMMETDSGMFFGSGSSKATPPRRRTAPQHGQRTRADSKPPRGGGPHGRPALQRLWRVQ